MNSCERIEDYIDKLIEERNCLVNIDHLTGINNRRMVDKIRKYEFDSMIYVDNFKIINYTFDHDADDNIINTVGTKLKCNI